jgi:hypothetical protein
LAPTLPLFTEKALLELVQTISADTFKILGHKLSSLTVKQKYDLVKWWQEVLNNLNFKDQATLPTKRII